MTQKHTAVVTRAHTCARANALDVVVDRQEGTNVGDVTLRDEVLHVADQTRVEDNIRVASRHLCGRNEAIADSDAFEVDMRQHARSVVHVNCIRRCGDVMPSETEYRGEGEVWVSETRAAPQTTPVMK